MEIGIKIDELTNCLIEQSTGKKFNTEYKLIEKIDSNKAIACKESWDVGNEGYVQFTANNGLVEHYRETLKANIENKGSDATVSLPFCWCCC